VEYQADLADLAYDCSGRDMDVGELQAAVAASSARRASSVSASAADVEAAERDTDSFPLRTPLSTNEKITLAAWVKKWRLFHKPNSPPPVSEVACLDGPVAVEIIGHVTGALVKVLSRPALRATAEERRRCLKSSPLGTLSDVLIGMVLSYQTISELYRVGVSCPAFQAAPSQHYLRNAVAGSLAETLPLSCDEPMGCPTHTEGGTAHGKRFEEPLILAGLFSAAREFCHREPDTAPGANMEGNAMLSDLARLPNMDLRLEALSNAISARQQLRDECDKLQRLTIALDHLNSAAGRQELARLFGTIRTVGHALLSGPESETEPRPSTAARGFTLSSLSKLKNVTCRYHPTFTLLHHVAYLWAKDDREDEAEDSGGGGGGGCLSNGAGSSSPSAQLGAAAVPETSALPERAAAMTAAALIVIDDEYASLQHGTDGSLEIGARSRLHGFKPTAALRARLARVVTTSEADRDGIAKLDQLLRLLLYDLEHQEHTLTVVQEQYCLFREFMQGHGAPQRNHCGMLIDSRSAHDEFKALARCARDAWCDIPNAAQQYDQAKASMLRVEAEGGSKLSHGGGTPAEPPWTKIAHGSGSGGRKAVGSISAEEGSEMGGSVSQAPENVSDTDASGMVAVQVGEKQWPPPSPSPRREMSSTVAPAAEFADMRVSLEGKFKARVTVEPTPPPLGQPAEEPDTSASATVAKTWKAWHFKPLDEAAAPVPPVFVVATDLKLSKAQTNELKGLFSRGAFVGLEKVRGKVAAQRDWFTMDRFQTGTTDSEGQRARNVLQEDTHGKHADGTASRVAHEILKGYLGGGGGGGGSGGVRAGGRQERLAAGMPVVKTVKLDTLLRWKKGASLQENGVEMANKLELYLDDADFAQAIGMQREVFDTLPQWKRDSIKKTAGLW